MSDRFHVATRKGLFTLARSVNGSGEWSITDAAFLGQNVTMSLADERDGAWYAAIDHGHFGCHLHRSRDQGKTWEEIAAPQFPAGAQVPDGMPGEADATGEPGKRPGKPAALSEIWALEVGGVDQSGLLWCGTIPGALFKSEDAGDSWQLVESLWNREERWNWFGGGKDDSGVHSIAVDPRDSQHVRLGISCGGVWRTRDGGATWDNVGQGLRADYVPPEMQYDIVSQDAHRLVTCPADPEHVWIQHHNGIFYSQDGGENFEEITTAQPSVFGFAVVVHPRQPQTAWFAPAKKDETRYPVDGAVVVSQTTDGGKTFTVHREGLPQQHAYDIVFRHAMDVDASGDHLAMGSSTGNLWTSKNGGQSWKSAAANLPPIYSVRFLPG